MRLLVVATLLVVTLLVVTLLTYSSLYNQNSRLSIIIRILLPQLVLILVQISEIIVTGVVC